MKKELQLEHFQGPLELLLQLIEQRKMEITQISIAQVTEQFLKYLDEVPDRSPEELADFLVVATRLLLLKSQALLPYLEITEEEDPCELETQLKMYKKYADAAGGVENMLARRIFLYERQPGNYYVAAGFYPPANLQIAQLRAAFGDVLAWIEPVVKIPRSAIAKVITMREKFCQIQELLEKKLKSSFHELVVDRADRVEVVVTFMAILELVKQQAICARQDELFADITIEKIQL